MLIPMEFLSPMTTRADSGKGVQAPRAGPDKNKQSFAKTFEQELDRHDRKMLKKPKIPDSEANKTNPAQTANPPNVKTENKDTLTDDKGEALAAGVMMGNQEQEVVFILEGEESVATPQTRAENTASQTEPAPPNAELPIEKQEITETAKAGEPKDTAHAEKSETAEFKEILNAKTDNAAQQTGKDNAAGEVTARTPEAKPSDNQANQEQGSSLKDNGNPSPLENENEQAGKTGQKDENDSYAKAVAAKAQENSEKKPIDKEDSGKENKAAAAAPAVNETMPPPLSMGIKPEQFKATQQMSQQAAQHPVKPENLFQEMISRVQTMQTADKSTMTIQLNPEFLGKVALEVGIDANGLHVKINAEDNGVRSMINSQITTLIESLQSKGITVSEVEVVLAGANFDNFGGSDNGKQQSAAHAGTERQVNKAKESIEYYTAITDLMDFYLDVGRSSVEYRA